MFSFGLTLAVETFERAPPEPRYHGGVMAKYAALVSSASEGAVTTGSRLALALSRPDRG